MKKIFILTLVLVMTLSLAGCAKKAKSEALLQYMNYDKVQMDILADKMLDSYNSVVAGNQFNNAVTVKEFKDNTRGLAEDVLAEAKVVAELIEDEELAEIHAMYIQYAEGYIELIDMAIAGIEQNSPDIINKVNTKVNELNQLLEDYYDELKAFGKDCDVEVKVDFIY